MINGASEIKNIEENLVQLKHKKYPETQVHEYPRGYRLGPWEQLEEAAAKVANARWEKLKEKHPELALLEQRD